METAVVVASVCVLVLVSAEDLRRRIIPNRIIVPAWGLALAANTALHPGLEWLAWSFGASLCFYVFARITRGGLGMGDVKLVGFLGALLGAAVVPALVVGTSLGAVAAAAVLLRHGRGARKLTFAYGPFLAAGGLAMLLF
jgi:leader peptidase (prepilin peptidase) / N-methyltransferase